MVAILEAVCFRRVYAGVLVMLGDHPVPDWLMLEIADAMVDDQLAARLRGAVSRDARVIALEKEEWRTLIATFDHPRLQKLRGLPLTEMEMLRAEGLA